MGLRRRLRPGSLPGLRIRLLAVCRLVFAADLRSFHAGVLRIFLRVLILLDQLLRSGELRPSKLRLWLSTGRSGPFMRPVRRSFVCFERRQPQ